MTSEIKGNEEIKSEDKLKIFITGGSGFIGSYLVPLLESQGHELLLLSNNRPVTSNEKTHVVQGNLETLKLLERDIIHFKPDVCIHLAWQGIPDFSAQTSLKNLRQGLSLISMLGNIKCNRVLFTGSVWEYGDKVGKVSENTETVSNNPFRTAKNSLNLMSKLVAKESGINFLWARVFYVYGDGQKSTSLLPNTIRAIKENQPLPIKNPNSKHDFIYATDVAKALSLLATHANSGDYNIGSGELTAIYKIVNGLYEILGEKSPYKDNIDDGSGGMYADISKIQATGWNPEVDLQTGLKRTLDAFRQK